MTTPSYFNQLLSSGLIDAFGKCLSKITELENSQLPSNGPRLLLLTAKECIIALKNDAEQHQFLSDYQEDVNAYHFGLQIFNRLLKYVENALNSHINPSVYYLIEQILTKTKMRLNDLIILTTSDLNFYEVDIIAELEKFNENLFLNRLFSKDSLFSKEKFQNFAVISLTDIFKDNFNHFSVLIHELGHFFERKYNLYDKIKDDQEIGLIFNLSIQAYLNAPKTEFQENFLKIGEKLKEFGEITQKWSKELIADIIALILIGPTYLFSFIFTESSLSKPIQLSDTHPPSELRFDYMEQIELKPVLSKLFNNATIIEELEKLLSEKRKNLPNLIDNENRPFFSFFSGIKTKFVTIIRDTLSLSPEITQSEINDIKTLQERLKRDIPPCELIDENNPQHRPADLISILNAGWLCLLENPKKVEDFRSLVLLAIEQSYIMKQFIENNVTEK